MIAVIAVDPLGRLFLWTGFAWLKFVLGGVEWSAISAEETVFQPFELDDPDGTETTSLLDLGGVSCAKPGWERGTVR